MEKIRLDLFLAKKGYFSSREKAKRAILEQQVLVNQEIVSITKFLVSEEDEIQLLTPEDSFVGRGAYKLLHAIDTFGISLQNQVVLDIGASTGGFTQVCLMHGAKLVYALDVGKNQLENSLRLDSRVVVMENHNFRFAQAEWFDSSIDFVCVDVSFISLIHIFRALACCIQAHTQFVFLVKPQFEAGPKWVNKHGVVSSKAVHIRVLNDIIYELMGHQLKALALVPSPIKGKEGNIEYLLYASVGFKGANLDVAGVVNRAFA